MTSLRGYGIGRRHIQQALEYFKAGDLGAVTYTPSMNTYIRCPVAFELWDLKPVVRMALRSVDMIIDPNDFTSQRYQSELSSLGFDIIRFDEKRQRQLGIRGFNVDELADPHRVFWSPLMLEQRNAFADFTAAKSAKAEVNSVTSTVFVRNSEFSRKVRQAANGVCDACKRKTFQTQSGDWFLEVHHKKWLSEGGTDTIENMVALCPNCHRQEHFGSTRRY
ncbi:hypothetical protein MACH17_15790 [Phaeobacter inhibens]|uniref:HNH endonuclease n=1 Tax=Phaeobacter inhibens TaxID=221822 RepID=UPI0027713D82|nr:HNH endonuclease signature motif containing protein [Phaeobacter inhibens]GLO70062.1 hypothetical protein MACH17_15790 [Phaeobacter inhibens]